MRLLVYLSTHFLKPGRPRKKTITKRNQKKIKPEDKKINIFDVVELENNDKATIKEKLGNNKFKAEIVNENGITKEIREIEEKEIKRIVIAHG